MTSLSTSREDMSPARGLQSLAAHLPERIADFYPVARGLGRKLVLVVGPTEHVT